MLDPQHTLTPYVLEVQFVAIMRDALRKKDAVVQDAHTGALLS